MFANFNFVNNKNFNNNFNNNNNNNYSNLRYNNSQANIEISYDNYFTNNYYKEIEKEKYANDLRQQIEENKLRKEMEKRKKEEEDLKDELRLIKENQQLEIQQKKENQKIISNNNNNNINNNIKTIKNNNNNNNNNKNNNNNNYLNSYLQQRANEIKTKDNEIKNLLSSINDTFFHQINRMNFELEKLKEVNLHSNLYKIDLAKSIQDLSNTLHKKNYDQSFKKDSMYKMMIETNKRKLNLQNHLKFDKIPYYNNNFP